MSDTIKVTVAVAIGDTRIEFTEEGGYVGSNPRFHLQAVAQATELALSNVEAAITGVFGIQALDGVSASAHERVMRQRAQSRGTVRRAE